MTKTIPDIISSPQQVQIIRLEIERCRQMIKEVSRRGKASNFEISADLKELLGAGDVTIEKLAAADQLLADAGKWQVIHLQLPAIPGPALRSKMAAWFRAKIKPEILVSFELNSALAGGFALRIGAVQLDHSFRKRLLESSGKMNDVLAKTLGEHASVRE